MLLGALMAVRRVRGVREATRGAHLRAAKVGTLASANLNIIINKSTFEFVNGGSLLFAYFRDPVL